MADDEKMKKLLEEWDEKDAVAEFVDSDDDEDDEARAKKERLKSAAGYDDDDDDDEETEEDEESEEGASLVESSEDEEEYAETPAPVDYHDSSNYENGEDDDDEEEDDPVEDKLKKKDKKKKSKKSKKKVKKLTEITADDNEEDARMKAMLAAWEVDMGTGGSDDDEDEDDDASEQSEREVVLDDNVVDHIVLAAGDLEEAMAEFEKRTGLQPIIAGTIKGLGIKCARISFADATYLEIIAPDPKGPGPIGELLKSKKIKGLTPFHWAVRTRRAEELKDEVAKFGYTPDHITMFGSRADGTPRKWEMLFLYGHKMGGVCPFFINWANSDHPCATLPIVGKLKKLAIRAPEDDPVHQLIEHVGVKGVEVEYGKRKFSLSFKTPNGTVKLSSDGPVGFKFPGFEADVGAIDGDDGEQDADVVFDNPAMPDLLPVGDADYDDLPPPAY